MKDSQCVLDVTQHHFPTVNLSFINRENLCKISSRQIASEE